MTLESAYQTLCGKNPAGLKDHELAKKILDNWRVGTLGEDTAKEVIHYIINCAKYPNIQVEQALVGRAEGLAVEL